MKPNGYQALSSRLHDGQLVYDLHLVTISDGKITAVWPDPEFTVKHMNDIPIRIDWMRRAQEEGAIDADEFWGQWD